MKTGHTPGPWKWEREWKEDEYSKYYNGSMGNLEPDILCFGSNGAEGIYCTTKADADLIAAAPDLLKALKRASHQFVITSDEEGVFMECFRAIQKAEGK